MECIYLLLLARICRLALLLTPQLLKAILLLLNLLARRRSRLLQAATERGRHGLKQA